MTRDEWYIEVRVALLRQRKNLKDVAEGTNYSLSHISKVACGCVQSKRVEDAMSNYLGIEKIDR